MDPEPVVRIRELKRDRVNFVLENVDLACGCLKRARPIPDRCSDLQTRFAES